MKIAITGEFRRGKDTVAGIIQRQFTSHPVVMLAFADALKSELAEMTLNYIQPPSLIVKKDGGDTYVQPGAYRDWEAHMRKKRDINGTGWQWWGEFQRQYQGEDYWIKHVRFQYRYSEAARDGDHIIITDMRHHNEFVWCQAQGFFTVRVTGPCRSEESRDPNHPSEIHVRELPVDFELINDGTMNDLTREVENLMRGDVARFFAE